MHALIFSAAERDCLSKRGREGKRATTECRKGRERRWSIDSDTIRPRFDSLMFVWNRVANLLLAAVAGKVANTPIRKCEAQTTNEKLAAFYSCSETK